ncbi:FecR domain-containing protein [Flavivirga abyssicola]|uniref:FecR family protein n=1 Tax=Flavivirga abyssicola TaxID=3063533 RepID=UPI0026E073E0|nr:FecR family protein [Flavivirga sp. MEBiC07777]WVK12017.1 FecR domain-containing protein [Flavivirga sp. MEBiC07777]
MSIKRKQNIDEIEHKDNEAIYNYVTSAEDVFNIDVESEKQAFFKTIKNHQNSKFIKNPFKRYYKYIAAASIIGVSVLIYTLRGSSTADVELSPIIVNNNIQSIKDQAILTLSSGENISLESGKDYEITNLKSDGENIIYNKNIIDKKEDIAFNYLTVPRAGKFQIELSDGTKVWLNSESQLKYPVSFVKGKTRNVELVYGEAYFDVSPSTNHHGSSFKVTSSNQHVEVLGTEFNIKAYKSDPVISTTLVEGKVLVSNNVSKQRQILTPNHQTQLNIKTNEITSSKVDPYTYIAWKDGIFTFENKSLEDLIIVLSRWYDIDVIFDNKNKNITDQLSYRGAFRRNEKIEEVLSLMKASKIIRNYEIRDKTVTLK